MLRGYLGLSNFSWYLGAEYLGPKKVNLSILVGVYKPGVSKLRGRVP